jgi:enoyl-CoA hydratase
MSETEGPRSGSVDTLVRYTVDGGVATITLDRPAARNAISTALVEQLSTALAAAEADPSVAVIVITGSDPAFCAGLDIKEFNELGRPPTGASELIRGAADITKPTIGAVNGPVMTGGLEFALGLDILIASERARFADTHAKVGLLPAGGMTARLPRAVGQRLAMEMSYTGRVLDADEALRFGLVTRVVPHGELLSAAHTMAATIAQRDVGLLQALKKLYLVSLNSACAEAVRHEVAAREARMRRGAQLVPHSDVVTVRRSNAEAGTDL